MKLSEITEPGFYWNRADEHREWGIALVVRRWKNPQHPQHNVFVVARQISRPGGWVSESGDFIGPIEQPTQ